MPVSIKRITAIRAFASRLSHNQTGALLVDARSLATTSGPYAAKAPLKATSTARLTTTPIQEISSDHATFTKSLSTPRPQNILNEQTLLSKLSPHKRILCLCPVPVGSVRIPWSGGDYCTTTGDDHNQRANHLDFSSQVQPPQTEKSSKATKYRYGEKYAIGVAVSDPQLTHAEPVDLVNCDNGYDSSSNRGFVAEMVPTYQYDVHNLGSSSPIFHTNLPYFRHDFLQRIGGHSDIGAIVLALPMKQQLNNTHIPTSWQVDQERKLEEVRECLLSVLHQYVCIEGEEKDCESNVDGDDASGSVLDNTGLENSERNAIRKQNSGAATKVEKQHLRQNSSGDSAFLKQKERPLGPLDLQGYIHDRLNIDDVLSKSYDCDRESCDDITSASIPPEIHAAVALNAMMEKYTRVFHNSAF